jgi:hypothetical protein
MTVMQKIFVFTILFSALTFIVPGNFAYAAKGGHSGGGSSQSSGGHDTGGDDNHDSDHGDDHSEDSSHSDSKGGKGKGPKYMGGRGSKVGHGGKGGHSVEDKIFHGKHGKRWSDDWTGGGHDSDEDEHGDTHDHS